ncbi:MAG: TenA family protein [Propioniciclava sp.]|uniref:TenA family protein n=1 Tax=Propioniciclava sp. TaxID=2038686 RepID=UPI0039E42233
MSFTDDAWEAIAPLRAAIDELPLLNQLRDGTLPREAFVEYLTQDALYLDSYARTLALAASQAPSGEQIAFWASGANNAVIVEKALHGSFDVDPDAEPSAVCLAYTSYLSSLATRGNYPVLVAGVLPCFWIYEDVGSRLLDSVGDLTGHPYQAWISTYADPAFTESTRRAKEITDSLAAQADAATVTQMHKAFATAARYEWMFWDAPMRAERWPI